MSLDPLVVAKHRIDTMAAKLLLVKKSAEEIRDHAEMSMKNIPLHLANNNKERHSQYWKGQKAAAVNILKSLEGTPA